MVIEGGSWVWFLNAVLEAFIWLLNLVLGYGSWMWFLEVITCCGYWWWLRGDMLAQASGQVL